MILHRLLSLLLLFVSLATAHAQAGYQLQPAADRGPAPLSSGGTLAGRMAGGDLDGDGDQDILAAGLPVAVHHQTAPLAFTFTPQQVTTALLPQALPRLVDLEGDGDLDALMASPGAFHELRPFVLVNDGTGSFVETPLPAELQVPVGGAELGDVDGDGDADLLVTIFSPAAVKLFRNQGNANFVFDPSAIPSVPSSGWIPALCDIDGDGDLDVVCSSTVSASLLLRNDGTGTFTNASAALPSPRTGYVSVVAADLDGDGADDVLQTWSNGDLDVTWGGTQALAWQSAIATGIIGLEPPAPADLDGDQDLDLVLWNDTGYEILRNLGGRQFVREPGREVGRIHGTGICDADNDGDDDVLVSLDESRADIHVVSRDGPMDVILELGMPASSYQASRRHPPLPGDVDGDGRIDLVSFTDAGLEVLHARGAARYRRVLHPAPLAVSDRQQSALADLDADGDLDLVYTVGELLETWRNDGTGVFARASSYTAPSDVPSTFALGDLDGDGDIDLVRASTDRVEQFRNDGTGALQYDTLLARGLFSNEVRIAIGDIDGDGDLDLVSNQRDANGGHATLRNDGGGRLSLDPSVRFPRPGPVGGIALGDADGDGDLDLFSLTSQGMQLLLNDGTGNGTVAPVPALVAPALNVHLGDLDSDGDLDVLLATGSLVQDTTVMLGDGAGNFVDASAGRWQANATIPQAEFALADFEGDGDLDVMIGNRSLEAITVINHQRQLSSATVPNLGGSVTIDSLTGPGYGTPGFSLLLAGFGIHPAGPQTFPGLDGLFDLDPATTQTLSLAVGTPAGADRTVIPVPPITALIGAEVFFQSLVLPSGNTAAGFSNVVVERILP